MSGNINWEHNLMRLYQGGVMAERPWGSGAVARWRWYGGVILVGSELGRW